MSSPPGDESFTPAMSTPRDQRLALALRALVHGGGGPAACLEAARRCSADLVLDEAAQRALAAAAAHPRLVAGAPAGLAATLRLAAREAEKGGQPLSEKLAEALGERLLAAAAGPGAEGWGTKHFTYALPPAAGREPGAGGGEGGEADARGEPGGRREGVVSARGSSNMLAGGTGDTSGQCEWAAGFWLGELALSQPRRFSAKRCVELGAGSGVAAVRGLLLAVVLLLALALVLLVLLVLLFVLLLTILHRCASRGRRQAGCSRRTGTWRPAPTCGTTSSATACASPRTRGGCPHLQSRPRARRTGKAGQAGRAAAARRRWCGAYRWCGRRRRWRSCASSKRKWS